MSVNKKVFCGGGFCFDYKESDYQIKALSDYRAKLLCDVELFLHRNEKRFIKEGVEYIGPFYFECEGMLANQIVEDERKMIEACTDSIFILDEANCPGTVSELLMAAMFRKQIHVFYVRHSEQEETESELHTPNWYPIMLSKQLCETVYIVPCKDRQEAEDLAIQTILSL